MLTRAAIPLISMAVLLLGCPPKKLVTPREGVTAESLLARLETAEATIERVRGEARLKIQNQQGTGVLTMFLAAESPGRVHLERLDFFGRPQLVLASDGAHYTLFDGEKGRWYRGPATAQAMARFFSIALGSADLAALLMGKAPRVKPNAPPMLTFDTSESRDRLSLFGEQRTDALYLAPDFDRVELAHLGGPVGLHIQFEEWSESNGVKMPRRVSLSKPNLDAARFELTWKDVELNGKADPALFTLDIPEGTPVIELDGRGEETALKPGANP
jgi:hypothetical protein